MKVIIRKRQLSSLIRLLLAFLAACTCLQYWLTDIHGDSHFRLYFVDMHLNGGVPAESSNLPSKDTAATRKHPAQLNSTTAPTSSSCSTRIHAQEVASDVRPPTAIVRKWAYAFLVSGCGEKSPGYKGFLYNIMVAAERLREMGSNADVVVLVQMAYDSPEKSLPSIEEELLCSTGVKIRYLPKARAKIHECFYNLMLEKFRVLELVEYSRVLYLDSDILPECNLDYIFELSEPEGQAKPLLKENMIVANTEEASNGGFFMLRPSMEDWDLMLREIRRKEEAALELPWPHWDPIEGWGHVIQPPDYWKAVNGSKLTAWDWHGVFTDQGLLYYWTKYVKKNVSIVIAKELEQWGSDDGGDVRLEETLIDVLTPRSCSAGKAARRSPPYRDYFHMTGSTKPWLHGRLSREWSPNSKNPYDQKVLLWKETLLRIHRRANVTLTVPKENERSPLGSYPTFSQMIKHIQTKQRNGWNQYQDEDDGEDW